MRKIMFGLFLVLVSTALSANDWVKKEVVEEYGSKTLRYTVAPRSHYRITLRTESEPCIMNVLIVADSYSLEQLSKFFAILVHEDKLEDYDNYYWDYDEPGVLQFDVTCPGNWKLTIERID